MAKKHLGQLEKRNFELDQEVRRLKALLHGIQPLQGDIRTIATVRLESQLKREIAHREILENVANVVMKGFLDAIQQLEEHEPEVANQLRRQTQKRVESLWRRPSDIAQGFQDHYTPLLFPEMQGGSSVAAGSTEEQPESSQPGETREASADMEPPDSESGHDAKLGNQTAPADGSEFGVVSTPVQESKLNQNRHRGGSRIPRQLKETSYVATLEGSDTVCSQCGGELKPAPSLARESEMIGHTNMEILRVIVVTETFKCGTCGHLESAVPPPRATPKGLLSLELGAHLATEKYDFHMPLRRSQRRLDRYQAEITAQNQFDALAGMARSLRTTHEAMLAEILKAPWIHVDQTPWRNLQPDAQRDYQLWAICTPSLAWFTIRRSKGRDVFDELLARYTGTVVADAASTHLSAWADDVQSWVLALCWAHLLRKFRDIGPLQPVAAEGHARIQAIFHMENQCLPEERRTKLKPLIDDFFQWVHRQQVVPNTSIAAALRYASDNEHGFRTCLRRPTVPLTNNLAERMIRPTVIGQNNHFGSRSPRGAEVAEIFYTMCMSARLADIDPVKYIHVAVMRGREPGGPGTLPADVVNFPHLAPDNFSLVGRAHPASTASDDSEQASA